MQPLTFPSCFLFASHLSQCILSFFVKAPHHRCFFPLHCPSPFMCSPCRLFSLHVSLSLPFSLSQQHHPPASVSTSLTQCWLNVFGFLLLWQALTTAGQLLSVSPSTSEQLREEGNRLLCLFFHHQETAPATRRGSQVYRSQAASFRRHTQIPAHVYLCCTALILPAFVSRFSLAITFHKGQPIFSNVSTFKYPGRTL